MCLAFGAESLDDVATRLADVLEMQPPQGLVEKVRGLAKLKSIADSMPKSVRSGPSQEIVLHGRRRRPRPAADPALLAGRPGAVHHAPGRDHAGSAQRHAQRRHVPDAEDRPAARRSCTGRSTRTARRTTWPPTGGSRSPSRSGSTRSPPTRRARRSRSTSTSSCSPDSCAASRSSSSRAKTVDLEVPANAEIVLEGYVEAGDDGDRGPVRRPHRLLLARRAVPGLPRHRDHDAARRDLPVDRRRQAACGGRLARQGDRAHLPAGDPDERAGDRRLRPARRGRVPQLRHRLDPQGLPRPRAEGDARDLGPRAAQPDQVASSSSTSAWTSTTTSEVFFRVCANVDPKRDVCSPRGRSTSSTTRRRSSCYGGKLGIDATHKGPARARASGPRRSR